MTAREVLQRLVDEHDGHYVCLAEDDSPPLRLLAALSAARAYLAQPEPQDEARKLPTDQASRTLYIVLCALAEANQMCRSAAQIVKRKGAETNWDAFEKMLGASLKRQHIVMHWDQYATIERQAFLAQFDDAAQDKESAK